MNRHTLILGGARSGKSARALQRGESSAEQLVYIATAEPVDEEMTERIASHRRSRGERWMTLEVPLALSATLREHTKPGRLCVVDCLTIWLSNLMHYQEDIDAALDDLLLSLDEAGASVILVSNEVGLGLVPETSLGRRFRDAQGRLNQRVAKCCAQVEFMAAGIPLVLKGERQS
ncbi:MAG: bifunctional adenosylcobinamide kinase/adenosylcobinamide-phosphate guanylyltransferase [Pseudomonadota bacterium]